MKNVIKYIPVYEYAKQNETSIQNVYRWIREAKLSGDDVKEEIISVKRIRVNSVAKPYKK